MLGAGPARGVGGSSGGSAVTVVLDTVPFGLGTDPGGSITIPASFCGIVGFRPTAGRYAGDDLVNLSWSRDTVGLLVRAVDDVRRIDAVITRPAGRPWTRPPGDVTIGRTTRTGGRVLKGGRRPTYADD